MWIAFAALALLQQDSSSIGYAARFRLWDGAGKPVAIVAYQLKSSRTAARSAATPVGFSVHQSDVDNRVTTDTTWTVTGPADAPAELSGYLLLPTRDELRSWSILAITVDGHPLLRAHATQRARDGVETAMSDLLVAAASHATPWPIGSDTLLVPRSDSVRQVDSVHLGYQIHGASRHGTARSTLTVSDISDPEHGRVVLRLAWNSALIGPVTTFDRIIDLSALHPGRYQLTLQSYDISGAGTTVRTADVSLIK